MYGIGLIYRIGPPGELLYTTLYNLNLYFQLLMITKEVR